MGLPNICWLILAVMANLAIVPTFSSQLTCSNKTLSIDRLADGNAGDFLLPFYDIAVSFINAVHLNKPLNAEHIQLVVEYFTNSSRQTLTVNDVFVAIKPLILDQIVFVCLLVFGLLFVVLFPLVGLIFCCCRLCDKCGGQKYQENSSSCCCATMSFILVVCILIFAAGGTLYGLNNRRLYRELDTVPVDFANQTSYVADFVDDVSDSLVCGINGTFYDGLDQLVSAISHVGPDAENMILKISGMNALREIQTTTENLDKQLSILNLARPELCEQSALLDDSIQRFLVDFHNSTISKGYQNVSTPEQIEQELSSDCPGENITTVPLPVNFTAETDSKIKELHDEITNVQATINASLNKIGSANINEVVSQIKKFSDSAVNSINDVQNKVNPEVEKVVKALSTSWYEYLGLIVIAPIALTALCLVFGLACGACTYSSSKPPFKRSCTSDCGGCCLLWGAALMFIFGWLLMALTIVVFSIGYLSESAVCQPIFKNPNHDALKLFPNITLDKAAGIVLNLDEVVEGCKANETVYEVLNLESVFNLTATVQQINQSLTNFTDEFDLNSKLDASKFVYPMNNTAFEALRAYEQFLLRETVPALRTLMKNLTEPKAAAMELQHIIDFLKNQTLSEPAFLRNATLLLGQVQNFTHEVNAANHTAALALNLTLQISYVINTQIPSTDITVLVNEWIANETNHLESSVREILMDAVTALANTVRETGSCRPLYDVYDNIGVLLCERVLNPLQGFWLSLGWCVVFFLPAVICGIKLAKYFRRMDEHFYGNGAIPQQARWSTAAIEMPVRRAW